MLLKSLLLRNFRNYSNLELEFPCAINLIVGDNAQGKSNLLEAIYFLCTAKSHRTRIDDELIKHGEDFFKLKGSFKSRLSSTVVEISKALLRLKRVKINGKLQRKSSHLIGQTSVVIFSPESLALVKGGPADRRKFLDIFISQINPTYLRCLQNYQLVLKQRNELLKQIREKRANVDLLAPWDKQLIEIGANIMEMRADIIAKLTGRAKERHKELTKADENLDIVYRRGFNWNDKTDEVQSVYLAPESLLRNYNNALNEAREVDILKGTTSIGPHRDDLIIALNDFEARRFGSQGQHRAIALSFKLAEIDLILSEMGELPIVLLDDVASELDQNRAVFLFNLLDRLDAQVFVTTTRLGNLRLNLSQCKIFEVKNGTVNVSNA
ncbi:MAG: DNA replication/repair protein RecF [Candidatus Poribacteria bacterium]